MFKDFEQTHVVTSVETFIKYALVINKWDNVFDFIIVILSHKVNGLNKTQLRKQICLVSIVGVLRQRKIINDQF